MKLEIYGDSKNYTCTVIKLPPMQAVDGLDNLVKVTVFGNDCLIGKDSNPEELYLFFPAESCIDSRFLSANDLYRHSELNHDPAQKGFFEDSGRVRSIKFKGIISTGFVIPVRSLKVLEYILKLDLGIANLKVNDEFNKINGFSICEKYRIQYLSGAGSKTPKKSEDRFDKLVHNQFRFHEDTSQLVKNIHLINSDDIIVITDKWHGTSAIFSNLLINKRLGWKDRLAGFFGVNVVDTEYGNIYASRKVIKNQYINEEVTTGYYNEDIWGTVNKELEGKIEQGITIYGEIVGFLQSGRHIQKGYDYGCGHKEHKFVVYRITYTKPDGNVIEFSWQQIKNYCGKYDLKPVEQLFYGRVMDFCTCYTPENLLYILETLYLEGACVHCSNNVPAEGICLRIDGKEHYNTFKLKSKRFLEHETKELDNAVENIEDAQ